MNRVIRCDWFCDLWLVFIIYLWCRVRHCGSIKGAQDWAHHFYLIPFLLAQPQMSRLLNTSNISELIVSVCYHKQWTITCLAWQLFCRLLVKDCEAIRQQLLGHKSSPDERKWTILGQSFGGFCAINYLSFHYEGIKEVFLAGGLAPLVDQPDSVYESLARELQNCRHVSMMILTDCPRSSDQTQYYLLRKISSGCKTGI